MIEAMDCGGARMSLGVYVLGAIDPAERASVDAHLATCRDCRDELAGLAGLPALLARVDREEAVALAEDDTAQEEAGVPARARAADAGPAASGMPAGTSAAGTSAAGTVSAAADLTAARRRRNWRNAGLSAAAAVILAAAGFGGARLAAGQGANPGTSAQGFDYGSPVSGWTTVHGQTAGMYATVTYRGMSWGTQLAVKVVGVPVGTPCQLVVVGPHGSRTVAGAWVTDTAEGTVYYPGSTGVPARDIHEFQITVAGGPAIVVPS